MYMDEGMRAFADRFEENCRRQEKERRKKLANIFLKVLLVALIIGFIAFVVILTM